MRFLVTGYKGQLGYDIVRVLKENGYTDIIAIDKDDLDITDNIDFCISGLGFINIKNR